MSPKTKATQPIDIYLRVSAVKGRDQEGESFLSPEIQEEKCRGFLANAGYEAGEVFIDLDRTGRKEGWDKRPGFDKAVARALDGTSGGIIVWRLSRFGRSTVKTLEVIEQLEEAGATVLSTVENLDTSSAMGRFVLTIFSALTELESETIRESWNAALDSNVRDGVYHGRAPAGYAKTTGGQLVPGEHADAVREAFRLRAEEKASWGTIAKHLDASGVPTQSGKGWTATGVARLIENRAYLGEVRTGSRVNRKAHEALVDERIFRLANAKGRKDRGAYRPDGKIMGAGLIRCGVCGMGMVEGKTRQPNGKTYRFLRCQTAGGGHPTIQLGVIQPFILNATMNRWDVSKDEYEAPADPELITKLENVTAEIEQLERELADREISPTIYAKAMAVAEEDKAALEEAVAAAGTSGQTFTPSREQQRMWGAADLIRHLVTLGGVVEPGDEGYVEPAPGDIPAARELIADTLGTITVLPGRGPVTERVTFTKDGR